MMDGGAYIVSRTELLRWVNSVLPAHIAEQLNVTKVEQCSTGVVYAVLLSYVFPRNSQMVMSRVKMNAKSEYDCRHNIKLVQDVLSRNNVSRLVEVDRIAKGNYQANLEFLQWLKRFSETQAGMFGGSAVGGEEGEDETGGGGGGALNRSLNGGGGVSSSRGDDTGRSSIEGGGSSPPHQHLRPSRGGSPRKSGVAADHEGTPRKQQAALGTARGLRTAAEGGAPRGATQMRSPSHQQRIAATAAPTITAGGSDSFVRSRSPRMVPTRSITPTKSNDSEHREEWDDGGGPTVDNGPTLITNTPTTRNQPSSFRGKAQGQGPRELSPRPTTSARPHPSCGDREVLLPRLDTQHAADKLVTDRRRSVAAAEGRRRSVTAGHQDPNSSSPNGGLRAGRDWLVGGEGEDDDKAVSGKGFLMDDASDEGEIDDELNETTSSLFGAFPLGTAKPSDRSKDDASATMNEEADRKKRKVAAVVAAAHAKKRERFGGGSGCDSSNASEHNSDSMSASAAAPALAPPRGLTRRDSDNAGNWLNSSAPVIEEDDSSQPRTPPTAVPRYASTLSEHFTSSVSSSSRLGKAPVPGMARSSPADQQQQPSFSSSSPPTRLGTKGFVQQSAAASVKAHAQAVSAKGPVMGTPRGSRVEDAMREVKEARSASRSSSNNSNAGSPNRSSPGTRRVGSVPDVISLKAAAPVHGRSSSSSAAQPNLPKAAMSKSMPVSSPQATTQEGMSESCGGESSVVQQERDFYLDKLMMVEEALTVYNKAATNPQQASASSALADRIRAILVSQDNNLPPQRK